MPSPAAAVRLVPPTPPARVTDELWRVEKQLATLVSRLRDRLDHAIHDHWYRYAAHFPPPPDPVLALRSGADLRSVVTRGVHDVLRAVVRESVAGLVRAAIPEERLGLWWGGQHDVDWVAHYDVHRRVLDARFDAADAEQWQLWAALVRSCGWWWPRGDVCVVVERPLAIRTEPVAGSAYGEVRLHNPTGPAVVFPDGWSVHAWHGTRVPAWVVESPTVELIAAERNVEVRRCAIERVGWAAFIDQAGLTLVGRADDPGNPGCELRLYDLPYARWGAPTLSLIHGLLVPPWFDDPVDAAGWSYGLTGVQYAQLRRRT